VDEKLKVINLEKYKLEKEMEELENYYKCKIEVGDEYRYIPMKY
jgi:hypothetical protein